MNPLNVDVVFIGVVQLVGFSRKPCLLTFTTIVFSRTGMPLTILGSTLSAITCAVDGLTVIVARVTTVPRLNGPATAGTLIDSP